MVWLPTASLLATLLLGVSAQHSTVVRNGANKGSAKHVGCYYGVWAYTRLGNKKVIVFKRAAHHGHPLLYLFTILIWKKLHIRIYREFDFSKPAAHHGHSIWYVLQVSPKET